MRAPEAPIGWPSATAPPLTLTLSSSIPSMRIELSVTDANASLISHRSMSSALQAGLRERLLRRARRACARGRRSRRRPAPARRSSRAPRLPFACAHSSLASTSAPPPSLTPGELPAVCEPSLQEDRRQLRERLERGVAPRRLVDLDDRVALAWPLIVTGDDLLRQAALVGRLQRQLVRAQRPAVHVGARHLQLGGDLGRLLRHVLAAERVGEAVVDHRVERLAVAHAEAEARALEQVGRVRHRLHAAADARPRGRRRGSPRRGCPRRACPEAQTLLIVSEETSFGIPALICAWREGICPWPACSTWPITTCWTCSGRDVGALERGLDRGAAELGGVERRRGRRRACRSGCARHRG